MAGIIIDTHAHYDDERFTGMTDALFTELAQNRVKAVITCAVDQYNSYAQCRALAEKHTFCYFTAGVHPLNMKDNGPLNLPLLREQATHKKCVGIGEIGLDYHYAKNHQAEQIALVTAQLQLANELHLPISFHDRDAHADTLHVLQKYKPRGVVHCFSGSAEMAQEILNLGMHIGIGGILTFPNAKKLVRVVEETPLQSIVLETDAPYLAPVPYRGNCNRSDYILAIAAKIAEIKKLPVETVLHTCCETAQTIFNFNSI